MLLLALAAACALATAAGVARAAADDGAAAARAWTSRIDYFNPGGATTAFAVGYRRSDGTGVLSTVVPVAAKASGSLLVSATVPTFAGSGVVYADTPLALLYRQQATGAAPTAPLLATPFAAAEAGSGKFFVPEVRRGPTANTVIGVQNLGTGDASVSLDFYPAAGAFTRTVDLPAVKPSSSALFDLATFPALGATFDGSLVIRAALAGGGAAPVAATAQTISLSGREAYAFSGSNGGSSTLLMTRATCLPSGTRTVSSLFKVQNAGTLPAKVVVSYYYPVTAAGRTSVKKAVLTSGLVTPGRRITVDPCSTAAVRGRTGVIAVIAGKTATGAAAPLAAAARWVNSGAGTQNALHAARRPAVGSDGKYRVVFPAVEWGNTGTRTTIDVMNAAPLPALAAKSVPVKVSYYSQGGALRKTRTLNVYTAASTDPSSAGALVAGSFKGAVVLESSRPIAAAARVQQVGYTVADGYAGLPW